MKIRSLNKSLKPSAQGAGIVKPFYVLKEVKVEPERFIYLVVQEHSAEQRSDILLQ
jgi:hypothetical protein